MDFLTGMAYWGIIVLVIVNAVIVSRMKVVIHDDTPSEADSTSAKEE